MKDCKPTLDKIGLNRECFDTASLILQERRPIDVEEIQRLSDEFYRIAADPGLEEFIVGQNRDPNLVLRLVNYLGRRHAIPPRGNDVRWFQEMFECLVELACPNCGGTGEDEQFFRDIEDGIATCRSDYQDDD